MKMNLFPSLLTLGLGLTLGLSSCQNLEDDDYFKESDVKNINAEMTTTDQTVVEYIKSNGSFSQMSALFEKEGIYAEMPNSGVLHTVFVVNDDNYIAPIEERSKQTARFHVANIAISPSKLHDGDRLQMWNNKFISVNCDSLAQGGLLINNMMFNKEGRLLKVVQAADGFVYEISNVLIAPKSLQDYINKMEDGKYKRFKQLVLSSGVNQFDRKNSKIVGIDSYGNTLYDSVFVYTNTFFDSKGFNLSNESMFGTMLYFSDEVIEKALSEAKEKLHAWGYDYKTTLLRNGSVDSVNVGNSSDKDIEDWILKTAFFRKAYSPEDLNPENENYQQEIVSIYDNIWRTDIQELDLEHPDTLSNGVAYEVKSFRIPNHRLIYRLHEEFRYYDQCSASQKNEFFKSTNLANFKVAVNDVGAWTPLPGVWPEHSNSPLSCTIADRTKKLFQMDFTPIYSRANKEGGFDVGALLVPPGTYRFAMGFKESMCDIYVQLFAINPKGEKVELGEKKKFTLPKGTNFHYDRGHDMSNMWPEYYNYNDQRNQAGSKNSYYWTDGGEIYSEVEIPDFKEDGSPVRLLITISGDCGTTYEGIIYMNHWCLRPTTNNY